MSKLNPKVFRYAAAELASDTQQILRESMKPNPHAVGCCEAIERACFILQEDQTPYLAFFRLMFRETLALAYWWGTFAPTYQQERFIALNLAAEMCS